MAQKSAARVGTVTTPVEALTRRGEELFTHGDVEGAIDAFSAAAARDPGCARARNDLGVAYWRVGAVDVACEHLAAALSADPGNRTALLNSCDALTALGHGRIAAALGRMWLRSHPDDREVREIAARCEAAAETAAAT